MWRWVLDRARGPLALAAALLGFAEVLHGPIVRDDVYRTGSLEARVRLAEHVRAREPAPVDIEVRNTSDVPCDLDIVVSDELAHSFDSIAMIPEPASPAHPWLVHLENVLPGEQRLVALELEGGEPGPRAGEVMIVASAGDALSIPIRTFVAP